MAPFPLGFFNAGLQADFLGHLARLAAETGTGFDDIRLELENRFSFSGSFFKGDGRGTAESAHMHLELKSGATASSVANLVRRARRAVWPGDRGGATQRVGGPRFPCGRLAKTRTSPLERRRFDR